MIRRVRRRRRQGGFTMMELLITLVISVFALMGILALHVSLSHGTTRASQVQEAVAIGAKVIETLRGKRPGDLSTEVTGSAAAPPYTNASYATMLGRNGLSYTVGVDVSSPATGLWLLHVDVSWTDDVTGDTTTLPLELIRTSREAL